MEKKLKITRKHSFGSVVMFFLCLIMCSTFILSFFATPWLQYKIGYSGESGSLIGLDFIFRITDRFAGTNLNRQSFIMFNQYYRSLADKFSSPFFVNTIYTVFSYALPFIYIFSIIWVFYFFVTALVYLFNGRISSGGIPIGMSISHFILTAITSGGAFFIGFYTNHIEGLIRAAGYSAYVASDFNYLWPIIYLSVSFVCIVLMIVVKCTTYGKHRIWYEDSDLGNYVARNNRGLTVANPAMAAAAFPSSVNINVNKGEEGSKYVGENSVTKLTYKTATGLPYTLSYIGGHAFSENQNLVTAIIPSGIESLGKGAFANCGSLRIVSIPTSVKQIGTNCFFNCANIQRINYSGTKEQWRHIKRGNNWLYKAGTSVVICTDGSILVNPVK